MLNTLVAGLVAVMAAGWDLGARAPAAPTQLDQFEFLIGCFRIDAQRYQPERNAFGPTAPTYWNGRWALGGWAVYDEWFNVQIPGQPADLGRGANLRMVDPETGIWTMVWAHTNNNPGQDLRAELREEGMVMWQVHPRRERDWKAVFEIIDADHWVRTEYVRDYATHGRRPDGSTPRRLRAARCACPESTISRGAVARRRRMPHRGRSQAREATDGCIQCRAQSCEGRARAGFSRRHLQGHAGMAWPQARQPDQNR